MDIKIAASILSADMCRLGEELCRTENAGADYIHFDVMDGSFVNNISYGFPVLKAVRRASALPVDVHLMINEPSRYIRRFAEYGADIITVHAEAESNIADALSLIRECGKKAGLAVKPGTSADEIIRYAGLIDMALIMTVEPGFGGQGFIQGTEDKIRKLRAYAEEHGLALDIEVDGGINAETAAAVRRDGANVLVAGSYLYKAADMAAAVNSLRGNG